MTNHDKLVKELTADVLVGLEDAKADFPDTSEEDLVWAVWDGITCGQSEFVRNRVRQAVGI